MQNMGSIRMDSHSSQETFSEAMLFNITWTDLRVCHHTEGTDCVKVSRQGSGSYHRHRLFLRPEDHPIPARMTMSLSPSSSAGDVKK